MKNKGKLNKKSDGVDKNSIMSDTSNQDEIEFEDLENTGSQVEKVKKLQKKLKECSALKQEYLDGWQRAKADAVNLRKSEEEKRKERARFAEENLLIDLLPALDSFDMAFANKEAWEKVDKNWRMGVEHIRVQILSILKQYNLEPFDPAEEVFDPIRHDSVGSVETKDKGKDHAVAEVLQKGYELNGKIIRPAKVKIFEFKK